VTAAALAASAPARGPLLIASLALLTAALALAGLALGPAALSPEAMLAALGGDADAATRAILFDIRAPRVALGLAVGAGLALSGVALQGVLRNPLADPGLVGVSAGAALGAVGAIVLGGLFVASIPPALRPYLLPLAAFGGGAAATAVVFAVARRAGETAVGALILAGVAVNAIAGAVIGALVYVSDDAELRDLTFWSMGGLGAADWPTVIVAVALIGAALLGLMRLSRALDLLQLGERAAFHAGLDVERAKRAAAGLSAAAVGAATAAAGPIGFVGLVAPHLARLAVGPSHRLVAPVAALGGAALLLAADLAARLAVPPAEPPVGLATSLIGGPFFLWLLLRSLRRGDALG
jgi:iron complex transport system permease protein